MRATYSPDDNKIRLYPDARLPRELYDRVRAAGFKWAPQQELFVAPMWTPEREDLLTELCGEIEDEDTALLDRAEDRAQRFEGYQENRLRDYESARGAVSTIADNIPLGQPILVGHHSERHARKDAERIENGMRRAVKAFKTAEYWKDRARGAIRHAKYKERPDVRARRIKTLEAEQRKHQRTSEQAEKFLKAWQRLNDPGFLKKKDGTESTAQERALFLANNDRGLAYGTWSDLNAQKITPEQAQEHATATHQRTIAWCDRWLEHYANRLEYERAMLADAGGIEAQRTGPEIGGGCKCWASPRGGWSYIQKVNRVSITVLDNWGNGGKNFTRTIPFDKLAQIMTRAQVEEKRAAGFLIDTHDGTGFILCETANDATREETPEERKDQANEHKRAQVRAMESTLKSGVQVVSAPQLFPTPPELAQRVIELADIQPGHNVLEPSAGTGALLEPLFNHTGTGALFDPDNTRPPGLLVAVEINAELARRLFATYACANVVRADFLQLNGELGKFDRIIMNPPFTHGEDIKHIEHARTMLKPGGRIVAICANGPRQHEKIKPLAAYWEELEPGTFQGTQARAALLTIEA